VLVSDFLRAFIVCSVGVQSQKKDKSTRKKMASVEKSPGPVSLNATEKSRYHKARDVVTTSIVSTSAAINFFDDRCAAP